MLEISDLMRVREKALKTFTQTQTADQTMTRHEYEDLCRFTNEALVDPADTIEAYVRRPLVVLQGINVDQT